ncbi:glycosyltransferase family 39 protein [bacterium]|nr:glycosyltransferase family 39 protein [bacterium]
MLDYIKEHKSETIFVCVITLFALILRVVALHNFGDLWVDELYSYYFANQNNPVEIAKTLYKEDFHVPLYFVLLHYWMKIFGQSDFILRLMGCLITTCSIPLAFYVSKNLFNKNCAYLLTVFMALNAFNIHYSCEVRFYGCTIFLAILSAYFFTKIFDNFEKKRIIYYIISTLFLLYTYNFAFMYVFCQFLIGLFFAFKNKKNIIKFLKIYLIIFIFYLPIIFYIFHSFLMYRTSILSFFRDIFSFDLMFFYNFFLACYSNIFEQWQNNNIIQNEMILKNFFNPFTLICMTLPVILGLIGLIKSLITKNKIIVLFFMPALILFLIKIILVFSRILALNLRYTVIPITFFTIISIFGWCLFKNKKLVYLVFSFWLFINISSLFLVHNSAINRKIEYSGNLQEILNKELKESDIVFIPRFSKLIKKYVHRGEVADFDTYDALLLGTRPQDIEFIFGKELAQKLNRKMLKTYLYKYITTNTPSTIFDKNLNKSYYSTLGTGQRFIIITDETSYLSALKDIQEFITPIDVYARSAMYYPLSAKIAYDVINSATNNLKFKKSIQVNEYFSVFIFEKSSEK